MRFAIIGCGEVGTRRATAIGAIPDANVAVCADVSPDRVARLSGMCGRMALGGWEEAAGAEDVDTVIISTSPSSHCEIAVAAAQNGKHIFCESPIARFLGEAERMIAAADKAGVAFTVAANHRRRAEVMKARELVDSGGIGRIIFVRAGAGHGGWEPVGDTWFASAELSGGGALISNGIRAIDLGAWLMGDFVEAVGYRTTNLWPIEPCEDNAFGLFKTSDGRVFSMHSSWTQWVGHLTAEIFGSEGYLLVDCDAATTTLGSRTEPTAQQVFDFSTTTDASWRLEIEEFVEAVRSGRQPSPSARDGLRALQMVHAVYESSETGRAVKL